jgi:hypothetical protein
MCQCAERRAVIIDAARASTSGDLSLLASATAFVARTLAQDTQSAVHAARARLAAFRKPR